MYNESFSRINPYARGVARDTMMGQVLGLLGFSFVFTALGAWLGTALGPGAFLPAVVVTFGSIVALYLVRDRAPLNLGLLYLLATAEGVTLGLILQSYVTRGLGGIVIDAAATTAAITFAAGAYGATTRRDLSSLGGILFVGLIGVVVASLLGIFIHLPFLHLAISLAAAAVFTGLLVYDFNRLANTAAASLGDAVMMTVSIYLDIFNLFLNLLAILQGLSGNNRD